MPEAAIGTNPDQSPRRPRGRPKGSKTQVHLSAALTEHDIRLSNRLAQKRAQVERGMARLDALALLRSVYSDVRQPLILRIDCAKAAVRYEKPMLSAIAVNAEVTMRITQLGERLDRATARERALTSNGPPTIDADAQPASAASAARARPTALDADEPANADHGFEGTGASGLVTFVTHSSPARPAIAESDKAPGPPTLVGAELRPGRP